jgi:hypothetical protein
VRPSVGRVAEGVAVLKTKKRKPTKVALREMRKIRKLLGLPLLRSNAANNRIPTAPQD